MTELAIKRIREAIESEYPPGTVSVRTVDARVALAALERYQREVDAATARAAAVVSRNNGRGARESTSMCRTCSRMAGHAQGCLASHGPDGRGD